MLIASGMRLGSNPMRMMGGVTAFSVMGENYGKAGAMRNIYAGDATVIGGVSIANKSGLPSGARHPVSWMMPQKAGGLSAFNTADGEGDVSASIAGGLNGASDLTGSGDITQADIAWIGVIASALIGLGDASADITGRLDAAADLAGSGDITGAVNSVLSIIADITGSGEITADMVGALAAAADITGTGDLTANIAGAIQAVADLTGSGVLTNPSLTAIWSMVADLAGGGDLEANITAIANLVEELTGQGSIDASMRADATISADISATADVLTAGAIADSVWQALAVAVGGDGTMAQLLKDAATKLNQEIINEGVQKVSLGIPHTTDLA